VHEVLSNNVDAVLFPPRNPAALAEKITTLMSDPELCSAIAKMGMQLIRTKYNWEQFAHQVEELFKRV
jgi:glycosyltransferase involved in cell wall biosynthesis